MTNDFVQDSQEPFAISDVSKMSFVGLAQGYQIVNRAAKSPLSGRATIDQNNPKYRRKQETRPDPNN
jgi:hypothetical protein